MQGKTLTEEIKMAQRVQEALLVMPEILSPEIKVAKRCVAAQTIGGDFFIVSENHPQGASLPSKTPGIIQYLNTGYKCLDIVIGDVAGHGVSSALVMALSSGLIRELLKTVKTPDQALQLANQRLIRYLENSQVPYITVFYARYYPGARKLEWAKGGHPPAVLLRQGIPQLLEGEGLFLGMFDNEEYQYNSMTLKPGDRVVFYTDGMTEARNPEGEELSEERFLEILKETSIETLDQQLEEIYNAIHTFSGHAPLKDDQTMVILEVK